MLSKDIKPGKFYRFGSAVGPREIVRIDRRAEPRYSGDRAVWEGTRWQVSGPFTTRHTARDLIEEIEPDAKLLSIIAVIEEMAAEERADDHS